MAKRNLYEARCTSCGAPVRAGEGIVESKPRGDGYAILCVECAAPGALDPPRPVEASRLPSIHVDYMPRRR